MLNLLKTFGKGILYVIGLPFFLVALVLFAVFGILAFLFQIIKSIIFFFTGQKFFPELPEDKQLRLMREAANQPVPQQPINQPVNNPSQDIIIPLVEEPTPAPQVQEAPKPSPTIEEACFGESLKEEVETKKSDDDGEPEGGTPILNELIEEEEEPLQVEEEEIVEEEPETVLETAQEEPKEEVEEEELETYVPRSSNYGTQVDDDEEDTDSGVDIDYDVR